MSRSSTIYASWNRARYGVTIVCLSALVLSSWLTNGAARLLGQTIDVGPPRHDAGYAFGAKLIGSELSAEKRPLETELYEIHTIRGLDVFSGTDKVWGWSAAYRNLTARVAARWPERSVSRKFMIGPGNQLPQSIREIGGGRYTVWRGELHFSAADNSSPITNGRRYELFVPYRGAGILAAVAFLLKSGALVVLGLTLLLGIDAHGRAQRVLANVLPGFVVSLVLITAAWAAYELYQRLGHYAFTETETRKIFDPVAGLLYEPGSEVKWTNHLDFWTAERVNSLGFLDAEPAVPKPAGRFRVLIVGDSFVEAAQVRHVEKTQTLLAAQLTALMGAGAADVVAFGHSGTGQVNQLGFYERFGHRIAPDLVILIGVANDFANNSPVLESIRNGWHPHHPPRLFVERDDVGYRRINPDAAWKDHRTPGSDPIEFHAALSRDPVFAQRLAGWGGPREYDMDAMFWRTNLPPLFDDAIDLTRQALATWKALGARDGFRVLVVAAENLTRDYDLPSEDRARYRDRFAGAAAQAGVPFFDLYPYFAHQPDPTAARFRVDRHWSATGHRWASEAIVEFLKNSGFLASER